MKGYLLTSRVEGPALWAMSRHDAYWYFQFMASDLKARWNVNLLCERLVRNREREGAAILWNAHLYLTDRAAYLEEAERRGLETPRR